MAPLVQSFRKCTADARHQVGVSSPGEWSPEWGWKMAVASVHNLGGSENKHCLVFYSSGSSLRVGWRTPDASLLQWQVLQVGEVIDFRLSGFAWPCFGSTAVASYGMTLERATDNFFWWHSPVDEAEEVEEVDSPSWWTTAGKDWTECLGRLPLLASTRDELPWFCVDCSRWGAYSGGWTGKLPGRGH